MRIAIANTTRIWGGAEKIMMELVPHLATRGHDVLLLVKDGAPVSMEASKHCQAVAIPGGIDLNPFGIWKAFRALRRWKADLLVVWTTKDMRIAAIAARLAGIPVIVRRSFVMDMPRTLRHRLTHRYVTTRYMTNALATRASLVRSIDGLNQDDVPVIYNGIDIAAIDAIETVALDMPPDALNVAFISRLDPIKGLAELMKAWPTVAAAVPNAHLLIVGTGELENELRAWAGTAERVRMLGFRKDAIGILKGVDILVLPSYREGTPNIVMEAMSCGKCIVATAVSGTPELVTNDVSARLIPPRNVDALSNALIEVLRDPTLRARLGHGARERIASFNFDAMVDQYIDLFKDVLAHR